jgi:hypothetical protein
MSRTLFIGDSHTCGYVSIPGKIGPGSYTFWNDNNYCDIYSEENNQPIAIYSVAGVNNRVYTDWLKTMFEKHSDIDTVFLCLASLNRFQLAFDAEMPDDPIAVDHFTFECIESTEQNRKYVDRDIHADQVQLFQKPFYTDYTSFPGFELTPKDGLISPNLRKHSYMQVKLFCEMNTFLEKRDFLNSVYTWDNICTDHNAKLYLFNFTERLKFPSNFEYYGKLKSTKISSKTVEKYFADKMIDHSKYLLSDNEHYNREYHKLVATQFLPWLKNS